MWICVQIKGQLGQRGPHAILGGINLSGIPTKALRGMLMEMRTAVSKQKQQQIVLEIEGNKKTEC